MLKVFTRGSEMGGTGFIAVEFETGREEGVRADWVTSTPLVWPRMEDGIYPSGATLPCLQNHMPGPREQGHMGLYAGAAGLCSPSPRNLGALGSASAGLKPEGCTGTLRHLLTQGPPKSFPNQPTYHPVD